MDIQSALTIMHEAILVAAKLCAPLLCLSMLVGLIISVFQAATQIHEQTLSFVPKLLVLALLLLFTGSWMLENLIDFTTHIFLLMQE